MNDIKKSNIWKIQLTITINFDCHRETDEERVMRSKNDNVRNHD